ncbi:MAG: peptidoglycan-binding protein [Opitutus sp.]
MSKTHIVEQGEHLSGIAETYGFHTYKQIWDDPANAKLKEERKNPNVLYPGDSVVIPDQEQKDKSCSTGARHSFRLLSDTLHLRFVVRNESDQAVANADYTLVVESDSETKKTDGAGKLEKRIQRSAKQARLRLKSDKFATDLNLLLAIGQLDPVDKVTGQISRLNNLAYGAGEVQEPADDAAREQFRSAIEEFQCNEKLTVDGKCGPRTQAKLKEIHGS